jgi:hypothetical protein
MAAVADMEVSCLGDHGDLDLQLALQLAETSGRPVPLVVFGHMHEDLKFGQKTRNMVEISSSSGTVFLNCAVVPRVRAVKQDPASHSAAPPGSETIVARHFVVAKVSGGAVSSASNVWVGQRGGRHSPYEIVLEQSLLELEQHGKPDGEGGGGWVRRRIWRGFEGVWESVTSRRRPAENGADQQANVAGVAVHEWLCMNDGCRGGSATAHLQY